MDKAITPMRPVILGALVVCVAVAMAPWMSGGQEPLAMLVSGGALLLGALLAWMQPEVRRLRMGPLAVAFGALVGFALLSLLWSANRYSTALWVTQWLMAGLAFRLSYTIAGEPKGREWLVRAYLASAAVFCVAAIGMYLTSTYERLTGPFYWANPAAAYLIPAIVVAVDKSRKNSGKVGWAWGGLVVLFGSSFLLANSRAGLLALILVLALYLFIEPIQRFWIKFVFILIITVMASFGLQSMSTLFVHKSNAVTPGGRVAQSGESVSGRSRLHYLDSAFEMWFARPLGGMGAGTYGDVHPQFQRQVVDASTNAHNVYVQVLAELGLVGAVALAGVLLWLLAGSLRGVVADPAGVPVLIGLAGLLMHFGLDIDASYPALLMLAAVLFGAVYRQWSPVRGHARLGWPVMAALLLVPLVSLYQSDVWNVRARAAEDDGDYGLAASRFAGAQQGLVFNPDVVNAEGIALYAQAASGGGATAKQAAAEALDRARRAEALDPHDGQHHQLEGRVLELQGDLPGAQAALRAALKLDPHNHPDYALDLAVAQVRASDVDGAVQTAQAMLVQYPQAVVDNRNMDETLRPTLADLEALVGNIDLRRNDVQGAKMAAQRGLALDPKNLQCRALMVQVKKHIGP